MNKHPKSQRRWVRDAKTPTVTLGGNYYNPRLRFAVCPIGHPEQTVTFELTDFQWRELCRSVRERAEAMAVHFQHIADSHARVFELPGKGESK